MRVVNNIKNYPRLIIITGPASSGKTYFSKTIANAFAPHDIYEMCDADLHSKFCLSGMIDKRLVVIDPLEDFKLAESIILPIISGELITVERKYRNKTTQLINATFIVCCQRTPDFSKDLLRRSIELRTAIRNTLQQEIVEAKQEWAS